MSEDLREKIARELHDFSCRALDPHDECGCWCGAGDRADLVIAKAVQPAIEQAKAEGAREALTSQAAAALRTAELAAAQGHKTWEADARFVAREAVEYRDAHYPEEER